MASRRAFVEVAPNAAYLNAAVAQDDVIVRAEDASQTLHFGTLSNLPLRITGSNVHVVGTFTADTYSNLPGGGSTYDDTALIAQATYGSNTAYAASNLVFGSVSNMATFGSNLSVANSNYVYGALLDKAVSASNLAQTSAAYLVGALATQLTGLEDRSTFGSNVSVWASNTAAVAGGQSGFAVTSNAVAYTACNVGVKVTQPSYDLTVGGTAGMTRLVIERSVDALSAGGVLAGPLFMQYASTSNYYDPSNGDVPITWQTRTHDSGSNWVTPGTSNITAPASGYYHMSIGASEMTDGASLSVKYVSGTVTPSNFVALLGSTKHPTPRILYMQQGSVFNLAVASDFNGYANLPRIVMHKVG